MKKYVLGVLLVIMLLIIYLFILSEDKPLAIELEKGLYIVDTFDTQSSRKITLLEAYKIGMDLAEKYDNDSKLVFMGSVNDGEMSGADGKKGDWQGYIKLPDKKLGIIFVIEKGKLKSYEVINSDEQLAINAEDIKVDSSQAVKKAISEFKLKPGNDNFLDGYHYRLIRDEENVFLGIGGQINGKRAEIFINSKTGNYLGGIEEN
ncbi:MAG: hypothetical protein RR595_08730 [Lysinibacillus sp.]